MAQCTGSLQPTLGNVDPNLKRPHQWEYTAMVQRQVGANTSVSLGYYGRRFSDLYTTVNAAVPPSAYTPVTDHEPADGSAAHRLQPGSGHARSVQNLLTTMPEPAADLQRRRGPGEHAADAARPCSAASRIGRDRGDQDSGDLNNPNILINNFGVDRLRLDRTRFAAASAIGCRPTCSSPARSARRRACRSRAHTSSPRRSCRG